MTELRYNVLKQLADGLDAGRRLLVALDFDGTLAPIVAHPECARIPEPTLDTLWRLLDSGRVAIAILSGRQLTDLSSRVELPAILSGNHGLEIAGEGLRFVHPVAHERAALVNEAVTLLQQSIACWPGAWVEHKGLTATVHFRNVARSHQYGVAMGVRGTLARFGASLGMRAGKCSLEIHPRVGWNKGSAIGHIRRELNLEDSPVLCMGDDATDETMFRVLPGHVTVCVGQCVRSGAAYHVPDVHAVGHALRTLHDLLAGLPEVQFRTSA